MPASASRSAIVCKVACRMLVLAPWPRTSRCVASFGRTRRAETLPFSGVARKLVSSVAWVISVPSYAVQQNPVCCTRQRSGAPWILSRLGEGEPERGKEDAACLAPQKELCRCVPFFPGRGGRG